jgi:hypothetical protein
VDKFYDLYLETEINETLAALELLEESLQEIVDEDEINEVDKDQCDAAKEVLKNKVIDLKNARIRLQNCRTKGNNCNKKASATEDSSRKAKNKNNCRKAMANCMEKASDSLDSAKDKLKKAKDRKSDKCTGVLGKLGKKLKKKAKDKAMQVTGLQKLKDFIEK